MIPALLFAKKLGVQNDGDISSIVIVISPLNALISDQISRLNKGVIRASALDVKLSKIESDNPDENGGSDSELVCDVNQSEKARLESGRYNILFAHPESLISCPYGRNLLWTKKYQDNVCALVIDEAHCILEW